MERGNRKQKWKEGRKEEGIIPSISLEQLGLDVVKLGVPSVYSVWVGVDSVMLCTGELSMLRPPVLLLLSPR